jgi:hypothetical protein
LGNKPRKKETYMSKNLTRKGLAFGALVALGASVFAGAPATAAGLDNTASLVPTTGYSGGYAVPASASQTFSLKYTTTNVAGATIKFKVTDPTGKIEPTVASAGRAFAVADNSVVAIAYGTGATDVVTITDSALAPTLATGDLVYFSESLTIDENSEGVTLAQAADVAVQVTVSGNDISFTASANIDSTDTSAAINGTTEGGKVIREARAADNSYVIDTGRTTSSTAAHRTQTVEFKNLDGATYSRAATVQGWADDANLLNDTVDTIESVSDAREIKFIKAADIAWTTALTSPNVGDTTLAATATSTPVLNGAQIVDQNNDFVRVLFTRQDSAVKGLSAAATQSTTTGEWETTISMADGGSYQKFTDADTTLTTAGTGDWGFTNADNSATVSSISVTAAKVGTITTSAAHNLRSGDKVTVTSSDVSAAAETTATVTVTGSTTFTYPLTETTDVTAVTDSSLSGTSYTVETYASNKSLTDRVFAGTHSAQVAYNSLDDATAGSQKYTLAGVASSLGTVAAAAADIKFTTAGSATLQGSSTIANDGSNGSNRDAYVKSGTTSATVTATVLDVDGAAVGAGRSVAFTIARTSSTITVNTKTASGTAVTDANGQVTFTVANTLGLAGDAVTIDATAEGVAGSASDITLEWADQAFTLYDLANSAATLGNARTVAAGTTQSLELLVADQWGTVPAEGTYRLRLAGSGVTEGFKDFVAGKATVTVTDSKVATSIASTIALQKKNTAGTFADVDATAFVLTTTTTTAGALTLAADASSLYASATADLSDLVAAKDLVARDSRTSFTAQPAYTNDVVVTGKVTNSSTGANQGNSVVTISGPSSVLFSNGAVDKLGGITVIADGSGEFAVTLYSTTAQKDAVITVKANGVEKTVKVSFTGVSTSVKKLTITPNAATYIPGQTVLFTVKLTDNLGNPVNTTAPAATPAEAYITVSYAGPGIISQTLPLETDASGEAQVRIVTGVVDSQDAVLTVKYDQNYDGDYADTYDLTATSTVTAKVAAATPVVAGVSGGTGKFNVAVTNAAGKNVVVKVAGKFFRSFAGSADKKTVALKAPKGSHKVTVYVGGKLVANKTVSVK